MPTKTYHRISYHIPPKRDSKNPRRPQPHYLRDGDAAHELTPALHNLGYEYGDLLLNYPGDPTCKPLEPDGSKYGSSDMLVQTTRPPINDDEERVKKPPLLRSYSPLEYRVIDVLRGQYFARCTRAQIILSDTLVASAPPRVAEKRNIQFRLYGGASYDSYTAGGLDGWHKPEHERTTAAYMIFEPEAWPGGPALLVAFGMGGTETLGWAHLLRTKFRHLVGVPGFVMAEIITTELPERAADLSFVDQWRVELLSGSRPICINQPGRVAVRARR